MNVLETRIRAARENEAIYTPNARVATALGEKSIAMLVSPFCTGKSFLIQQIVALDSKFNYVPSLTTRNQRPDDEPGTFRYISPEEALTIIEDGNAVQYAVHPTTGKIYMTTLDCLSGECGLLPTLSTAVATIQSKPFRQHFVFGISTQPAIWERRIADRVMSRDDRTKRLRESLASLTWLLAQGSHVQWVDNSIEGGALAAQAIIDVIDGNVAVPQDELARLHASQMFEAAKRMLQA